MAVESAASGIQKDVVMAVLAASVAAAGLLLVFFGFLYAKGAEMEDRIRGDRLIYVAKAGVLPFALSLCCAWLCTSWSPGDATTYYWIVLSFRAVLILTFLYGAVSTLFM